MKIPLPEYVGTKLHCRVIPCTCRVWIC